jgi:hypothetical protein
MIDKKYHKPLFIYDVLAPFSANSSINHAASLIFIIFALASVNLVKKCAKNDAKIS